MRLFENVKPEGYLWFCTCRVGDYVQAQRGLTAREVLEDSIAGHLRSPARGDVLHKVVYGRVDGEGRLSPDPHPVIFSDREET